jgi:hypothetical protein
MITNPTVAKESILGLYNSIADIFLHARNEIKDSLAVPVPQMDGVVSLSRFFFVSDDISSLIFPTLLNYYQDYGLISVRVVILALLRSQRDDRFTSSEVVLGTFFRRLDFLGKDEVAARVERYFELHNSKPSQTLIDCILADGLQDEEIASAVPFSPDASLKLGRNIPFLVRAADGKEKCDPEVSPGVKLAKMIDTLTVFCQLLPENKNFYQTIKAMARCAGKYDAKTLRWLINHVPMFSENSLVELSTNEVARVISLNVKFPVRPKVEIVVGSVPVDLSEEELVYIKDFYVFEPGQHVTLDTGEKAEIVKVDPDFPNRPIIKIIGNAMGKEYSDPKEIDLKIVESYYIAKPFFIE